MTHPLIDRIGALTGWRHSSRFVALVVLATGLSASRPVSAQMMYHATPPVSTPERVIAAEALLRDPLLSSCATNPGAVVAAMVRLDTVAFKKQLDPAEADACAALDATAMISAMPAPSVASFASASWQSELIIAVAALVERSARATIEAFGVEQARTLLCDREGGRYLPTSCALLKSIDPFVARVPWTAASGAFRSDLRQVPTTVIGERLSGRKELHGAPTVAALARAIVLLERGEKLPSILEGAAQAMQGMDLQRTDAAMAAWLKVAASATAPSDLPRDEWRAGISTIFTAVWGTEPDSAVSDALWALRSASVDIQNVALRADALRRANTTVEAAAAYAAAFNTYTAAVTALLEHVPRTLPLAARDSSLMATVEKVIRSSKAVDRALAGVRAGAYSVAVAETLAAVNVITEWRPAEFVRFASFGAELAEAKNAEEIGAALTALATPPGGYRSKRRTNMFGINAYLGGQVGTECSTRERCGAVPDEIAYGAFMPLGLEAGIAIGGETSLGLFASLLDLGQLLTARERDAVIDGAAVVNAEPRIGLRQIISPGLFLTLGPFDWPVAFGVGASVAPHLRTIEGAEGEEAASVVRALFFAAVDVPLFRFR